MRRNLTTTWLLALVICVSTLGACGVKKQEGLLIYRASMPGGGDPDFKLLERVTTKMELRLGEEGVERKSVGAQPPNILRVVLPESEVGRIPELRKALENDPELPVELTFVGQGE
jgi:hypothetical protein